MAAYPNEERDPARGFSMNIQPAVPAPVPRVASPSMAQPDVAQLNTSIANAVTPAPAQPGGAVFGIYPNVAGGSNRVSYATDAALRTGVEAASGGGFQPAAPSAVAPGLKRDLPQGVEPSVAGGGRGFVNPAPAVASAAPATAVAPAPAVASSVVQQSAPTAIAPMVAPRAPAGFIEKTITSDPNPALVGKVTRTGVAPRGLPGGAEPGGPGTVTMIAPQGGFVTQPQAEPMNPVLATASRGRGFDSNAALREAVLAKAALTRENLSATTAQTKAQTGEVQARTAQTNVTTDGARGMQSATAAYEKALESGDPKQIQKAEERLRARQGKYEREQPDVFDKVQVGVDPTTGAPIFQIYSKRTGKPATEQPAGATPASKGISKDAYAKLPNGAQYIGSDGKPYIKREAQPKG